MTRRTQEFRFLGTLQEKVKRNEQIRKTRQENKKRQRTADEVGERAVMNNTGIANQMLDKYGHGEDIT